MCIQFLQRGTVENVRRRIRPVEKKNTDPVGIECPGDVHGAKTISSGFQPERTALASTDTERNESSPALAPTQFYESSENEPSTRGSDWMTKCDASPVDVKYLQRNFAESPNAGQVKTSKICGSRRRAASDHLSRKRFVDLDEVRIFETETGALFGTGDRVDRSQSHARRFAPGVGVVDQAAERQKFGSLQRGFTHHEQGHGAICDLGGIARGHGSPAFFENGPQLCEGLQGLVIAHAVVGGHNQRFAATAWIHRPYFLGQPVSRRSGALV